MITYYVINNRCADVIIYERKINSHLFFPCMFSSLQSMLLDDVFICLQQLPHFFIKPTAFKLCRFLPNYVILIYYFIVTFRKKKQSNKIIAAAQVFSFNLYCSQDLSI